MGNFYTNVTVSGPDRADIASYLEQMGCSAYLTELTASVTTLCEEHLEPQDGKAISDFARELSKHFRCSALAVINHDDDILGYVLYDKGERDHAYNSSPWFFEGEQLGGDFDLPADQIPAEPEDWGTDPELPAGGDAEALVRLLGMDADQSEVDRVLYTPETEDSDEFVFAFDRHRMLLEALGLPTNAVVFGVRYLKEKTPAQLEADSIFKIGRPQE